MYMKSDLEFRKEDTAYYGLPVLTINVDDYSSDYAIVYSDNDFNTAYKNCLKEDLWTVDEHFFVENSRLLLSLKEFDCKEYRNFFAIMISQFCAEYSIRSNQFLLDLIDDFDCFAEKYLTIYGAISMFPLQEEKNIQDFLEFTDNDKTRLASVLGVSENELSNIRFYRI